MALLLPLDEHHQLLSSLLGGDHLRLKLSDDDFLSPLLPKRFRRQILSSPYSRHRGKNVGATPDKNFRVNIDVQQFSPDEIKVKSVNDEVIVECQHEEKPDEHGYISRHFIRKYKVPKGYEISKCVSKLSSDGILTITAPKIEKNKKTEIEIPVTFTNQPSIKSTAKDSGISKDENTKMEQE
ncbi:hypothetical protein NQ317_012629 [Molorchus minor]|uniref:SHSP domain-containing protein n=1 Tax=Molorchus minor TaxID=1323400 RepID=A0ABQ9J4H9_9CUCU|nr:hypothetical protein NQ317_012629 [Molorchus minor]